MSNNPYRDFIAERNHAVPLTLVSTKRTSDKADRAASTCGSGWYHDDAIRAAQQAAPRKH